MSVELVGSDALDVLNAEAGEGNNNEYTSFKSGTELFVKVLGTTDIMVFDSYGIFKRVNSFVAEKPSQKSAMGFPQSDLTPWDKAFLHYRDQSQEFGDKASQEAYKFKPKRRFAMGFYDLTSGEQIVIDVTKNQAQAIHKSISQYKEMLDTLAFKLTKTGQSTNTTVTLMPIVNQAVELTDQQRANFEKAPEEFDTSKFEGINFTLNEEQMVEKLAEVGFDVTLIGYDKPTNDLEGAEGEEDGEESEFGF